MAFGFTLEHRDGRARAGRLRLARGGEIETPVFMPVGTQAVVKTLSAQDLDDLGARMILCNAYHLYLRPGHERVAALGGLNRFMGWGGGVITDSGGYQVFSLAPRRKLSPRGVEFSSHVDGSRHMFTPESSVDMQRALGADIAMALDVCAPFPAAREEVEESVRLTTDWARRSREQHARAGDGQVLFGIVQGGVVPEARAASVRALLELDFPGYGIGGLSVGEGSERMQAVLDMLDPRLPEDRPRYLMGVGTPEDLWAAVARGVDMFDCAMPTRIARNGTLFTSRGRLVIRNAAHATDPRPPDPACACPLCRRHSRAYLRHLFNANETTALRLSTLHNLTFMVKLAGFIRKAIKNNGFSEAEKRFFADYRRGPS